MSSPCCFHGCCNQKFCAHRDGLRSEDVGDDDDCGCADDDDCVGDDDDCGGADDGDGGDGSGEHDKEVDGGDDDVGDKNDHAFSVAGYVCWPQVGHLNVLQSLGEHQLLVDCHS